MPTLNERKMLSSNEALKELTKSVLKHQDTQMFGLKLNIYEQFSPTWGGGSRKRDISSSGWKYKLLNLAL